MKRMKSAVKACSENKSVNKTLKHQSHIIDQESRTLLRQGLLNWYDKEKRALQWREMAQHEDPNIRAYSVLVSEIMLQQTQVATVKPYYARWMKKWPDVAALSKATLEEVNTLWSGLGYYSRARRLHEAACKVTNIMNGNMPKNAELLQRELPGVGPYTAAAIASIAYNEPVGLVDGNVVRVITRLCCIGANTNQKSVMDTIWKLASEIVDPDRPGDFNQAIMELGATVCTPKSPSCVTCPVSQICGAYRRARGMPWTAAAARETRDNTTDIEDVADCSLCLPADQPWKPCDGVTNYPRKAKKMPARLARNVVLVVERDVEATRLDVEYLLWQRPPTGLLASLWEFPSFPAAASAEGSSELQDAVDHCTALLRPSPESGRAIERVRYVADVFHQFSHISQTYAVYRASVVGPCEPTSLLPELPAHYQAFRWMSRLEIADTAISTAMKKVFERALARNNKQEETKRKETDEDAAGNPLREEAKRSDVDGQHGSHPSRARKRKREGRKNLA